MILSLLIAAAVQTAAVDPLEPARKGLVQCQQPNAARRTCLSLQSYTFNADGTITNRTVGWLGEGLVMTADAPIVVRDGAVCASIPDVSKATFTLRGAPASDDVTNDLRGRMSESMASLAGIEFCTTYIPDGEGFTTRTMAGETPFPGTTRLIWVSPDDGWRVQ